LIEILSVKLPMLSYNQLFIKLLPTV